MTTAVRLALVAGVLLLANALWMNLAGVTGDEYHFECGQWFNRSYDKAAIDEDLSDALDASGLDAPGVFGDQRRTLATMRARLKLGVDDCERAISDRRTWAVGSLLALALIPGAILFVGAKGGGPGKDRVEILG